MPLAVYDLGSCPLKLDALVQQWHHFLLEMARLCEECRIIRFLSPTKVEMQLLDW
jgi:hypothetical protein